MITFIERIINTIAPGRCAICNGRLAVGEHIICAACNLRLDRTCYETNPFENDMAKMFWGRFHIEKAAALFFYHPHTESAKLIKSIKYYDHANYAFELGRMMASEFQPSGFFDGMTAVVPVPLAANRERQRGYNQSREMAAGICSVMKLPLLDKAVRRRKFVASQTRLSRSERNDNVACAFSLVKPEQLHGHHVLIIDDVATTGATITALAREILNAGDVKVSVLTAGLASH